MENNYNNNFNSGSPYPYNQTNQQTGDGTNTSWSGQVNGNTSQGYSQGTQYGQTYSQGGQAYGQNTQTYQNGSQTQYGQGNACYSQGTQPYGQNQQKKKRKEKVKKEHGKGGFGVKLAKCAAIAEKEYGSLKKYDDAVFLTVGTGIGGAVYLGGKLLKPKKYEGFEIGHMVIEKDGIKCNCGRNGCFEKYASMKAFKEAVQRKFEVENLTGREIRDLLNDAENREKAQDVIDEYIEKRKAGK